MAGTMEKSHLVLSLFPGIGLLDMAFEEVGFCVVRGPDVLWGGDIRRFHPPVGRFDGVIGGPPCQCFSALSHMVRHNGFEPTFGNLIPEFERCVAEASPQWFLMENVTQAPLPRIDAYDIRSFTLNNRQCLKPNGEPAEQNRVRRLTFGWRGGTCPKLLVDVALWQNPVFEYAACGGTHGEREQYQKRGVPKKQRLNSCVGFNIKSKSSLARLCELQGLSPDFLIDAPFTIAAKCKAVGNGVPLPMGRALAKAIKEAVYGN